MPLEGSIPEGNLGKLTKFRTIPDYLRILLRRRRTVLGVFLIIMPLAALYIFTCPPRYSATAQLLIERHLPQVLGYRQAAAANLGSQEFYHTQYKLLDSWALTQRVINKLKLEDHPDFAPRFQQAAGEENRREALAALTEWLQHGLSVLPIRGSSLVNVSFSHPDPDFAATVANAFAQAFIEMSLDLRFAASQEAAMWLQEKLKEARHKLEESEARLNQYRKANNIVATEDKETITPQRLEQLNKELVRAQTRRLEIEARFKEASQGRAIKEMQEGALIQTMKAEEAKIHAQLSEMGKKYGNKHPRMIQLRHELAAAQGKISTETRVIAQTINNEYHIALEQERNLKAALQAAKSETQDLSERSIPYRLLLRDVETNRALYENILKSLKETTATENVPAINIRIVHPAAIPTQPVGPRRTRNLVLALLLALAVGAILAVMVENADTTIKTPEEIQSWLKLPHLAMIPRLERNPADSPAATQALVAINGAQPVIAEAFRSLRTSILFSAPSHCPRTILLTSSLPMEGKTFTAANLAAVMAQTHPEVLLVDADLRRPSLHRFFGVAKEPGLSNFLVGEIDELPIIGTPAPHLSVVPGGRVPPNPSELIHSARMQEFLTRALARFGCIIIDSPPLVSFTDAAILATLTEGVLLVVKAQTVPRKVAQESKNKLLDVRARLLGVILNEVSVKPHGYYYSHYFNYRRHQSPEGGPVPGRPFGEGLPAMKQWVKDRAGDYLNKLHGLLP